MNLGLPRYFRKVYQRNNMNTSSFQSSVSHDFTDVECVILSEACGVAAKLPKAQSRSYEQRKTSQISQDIASSLI